MNRFQSRSTRIRRAIQHPGNWFLAAWIVVFSVPWLFLCGVPLGKILDRIPPLQIARRIPLEDGWVATIETTRTIGLTESTRLWIHRGDMKRTVLVLGDVVTLEVEKDGDRLIVTCKDRGGVDLEDQHIRLARFSAGSARIDVVYLDLDVPEHRA